MVGVGSTSELPRNPKDAFYTAVGLAVLATQRFQVRRREIQKQVQPAVKSAASATAERLEAGRVEVQKQLRPAVREAAGRLRDAAGAVDERVDPVLDRLQQKLPTTGSDVIRQARVVAKSARDTVLDAAAGSKPQSTAR